MATYLSQNTSSVFLDTISDFHLLLFLVTNEVMPLQVSALLPFCSLSSDPKDCCEAWCQEIATPYTACESVRTQHLTRDLCLLLVEVFDL